jgi:diguanylate cyclase (GGDEF)-like protein
MPSEQQLSDVLSEFARTMVTDFPIQGILDHLVLRIVDILPITGAGVTLIAPGSDPRYISASNDEALRFEQLQTELGEGPCLAAYQTGEAVAVPDLREDGQFPRFGPRALAEGLTAVFTFPLRKGDAPLGALDLYRDTPGPLDQEAMTAAQTLADVVSAYLLNAQARADLQESADRSHESARRDPLTGLPNRVVLLERLDRALLRDRRSGRMAAVLFTDLDEFKTVNDLYGHKVGDELLVAVAKRLSGLLRPGDTLARLAGDEFVILCEDLMGQAEVDVVAARIGAALADPFMLSSGEVDLTASTGIALAAHGTRTAEELLHDADLAMYQAKRRGGATHQVIDLGEQRLVDQRARLRRDLRSACRAGELRMEYQPMVGALDGRVVGVEGLVRWAHPSLGLISAATFIPLAEQAGLILEIGQWVLHQSCLDLRRWREHHQTDDLTVAVNVSAQQLMTPGFPAAVEEVLLRTGTAPKLLTLEVTEGVFVRDRQRALAMLDDLKRIGVMLALDHFGIGHSVLSTLHRFPVDIVKIAPGFEASLGDNQGSHAIVSAVVDLAHALGLTVYTVGVETERQYVGVAALGSDRCQGYYFARPMSADAFDDLMGRRVAGGTPTLPALVTSG